MNNTNGNQPQTNKDSDNHLQNTEDVTSYHQENRRHDQSVNQRLIEQHILNQRGRQTYNNEREQQSGNNERERQSENNEREQQSGNNERERQSENNEREQQSGNNERERQSENNEREQQSGNNERERQSENNEREQQSGNNERERQSENNEREQQSGNHERERQSENNKKEQQSGNNEREQQSENNEREQKFGNNEKERPSSRQQINNPLKRMNMCTNMIASRTSGFIRSPDLSSVTTTEQCHCTMTSSPYSTISLTVLNYRASSCEYNALSVKTPAKTITLCKDNTGTRTLDTETNKISLSFTASGSEAEDGRFWLKYEGNCKLISKITFY